MVIDDSYVFDCSVTEWEKAWFCVIKNNYLIVARAPNFCGTVSQRPDMPFELFGMTLDLSFKKIQMETRSKADFQKQLKWIFLFKIFKNWQLGELKELLGPP